MDETFQTILLLFVLGVFAWYGSKRGFIPSLIQLGLILAANMAGNREWLGKTIVRIINRVYMLFDMMINGGATLIGGSGGMSADKFGKIFNDAAAKPPLIAKPKEEIFLFILMLALITLSFVLANKSKSGGNGFLGAIVGLFSGLMITYIFLPILGGGEGILPTFPVETPWDGLLGVFQLAANTILTPISKLFNNFGPSSVMIAIVLIVIIAMSNTKGGKK